MTTNDHLHLDNQEPENKQRLARAIEDYLEYSYERSKSFPVPINTVHNFYETFMRHTYRKLLHVNPDIIKSFTIKLEALKNFIAEKPQAKYIKLSFVQVPEKFNPKIINPQLSKHSKNLYCFFTLANSHNTPHLCSYYDLNFFNEKIIEIHENDVESCIKEFHAIEKPGSIRKAMLDIVADNTEHIYMNIEQMKKDFFPTMEKCAQYISFVFCEIVAQDKDSQAAGYRSLIKNNDKHLGCLLVGFDKFCHIVNQAPVYDFNSLCPNMCPGE